MERWPGAVSWQASALCFGSFRREPPKRKPVQRYTRKTSPRHNDPGALSVTAGSVLARSSAALSPHLRWDKVRVQKEDEIRLTGGENMMFRQRRILGNYNSCPPPKNP